MRALFVLNSLNIGGSQTKAVRLVNALLRQGALTDIATLNPPGALLQALDPEALVWRLQRRGKFSITALGRLRKLICERRPEAVFAVGLYPALYVALAVVGMANRPRIVASVNTTDFARGREWEPAFYRHILRRFDHIVYGCELQRSRWLSLLGTAGNRSVVIYNGVDTVHFAPQDAGSADKCRFGVAPHAFVIGTVGRLAPEKNHSVLIDALAEMRSRSIDAHLLIVGEGRMRSQLERHIAERGVAAYVTLVGVLDDVRPALKVMDVFVLPSTHIETFSNAALEAMAMQKPVVLSRVGGASEMIEQGVEGFVLEPAELAVSLAAILERLHFDAELRERMGCAARSRVARDFSLHAMVDGYAAFLAPVHERTETRWLLRRRN